MKRKLEEEAQTASPKQEEVKKQKTQSDSADFTAFGLDPRLLQAVKREKFTTPTLVQSRAIPAALNGQSILSLAKTGTGKTLAYLLPILQTILSRKSPKSSKTISTLILVPTNELAAQVTTTLKSLTSSCTQAVRYENLSRKEDVSVTKSRLAETPDIVVATPSRVNQFAESGDLELQSLKQVVIDEADLVLTYGHDEALQSLSTSLPSGVQKIFMSATLRAEVDELTALFFAESSKPVILDLSQEEAEEEPALNQYVVKTAEQDKFLLLYTIFKLQLIKGKVIIFVADIDRCYRVKLFLEQFGIRSCILNSELPVNSRLHAVNEFNKGVYDIIIAADENEIVGEAEQRSRKAAKSTGDASDEDIPAKGNAKPEEKEAKSAKRSRRSRGNREFGVSRGIDFRNVSCVLNFDLPTTSKSYIHRVGRTARAGQTGMALSFYVPSEFYRKHKPTSIEQCKDDEKVLAKIKKRQEENGTKVEEWAFDMSELEAFRYRLGDALRAVTRIAIRETRTKELRQELINSEKLKRYFEENPDDLKHLRHDTESHAVRQQPHLKHVPDYLMPAGGKQAVAKDIGFVSMKKDKENRIRKARATGKNRRRGMIAKTKGLDPLKSLNVRGRTKK